MYTILIKLAQMLTDDMLQWLLFQEETQQNQRTFLVKLAEHVIL